MKKIFNRRCLYLCLTILFIIVPPAMAEKEISTEGRADKGEKKESGSAFSGLEPHKENYVLPIVWGSKVPGRDENEFKFQFSVKQRFGDSNLYFGYTQKSFWQIYDDSNSRPFRESNYNPELFWHIYDKGEETHKYGVIVGLFEHESNGSSTATSRSWNRSYLTPYYKYTDKETGRHFRADLKLWLRWSEDVKKDPADPAGDDNPDIHDYYGYSELKLGYGWSRDYDIMLFGRWNPETNKGAFQADLSTPVPLTQWDNVFLLFQYWEGYGESLIDYNRDLTRYGAGLIFRN